MAGPLDWLQQMLGDGQVGEQSGQDALSRLQRYLATSGEALGEAPAGIAKGVGDIGQMMYGLAQRQGMAEAGLPPAPESELAPLGAGARTLSGLTDFLTGGYATGAVPRGAPFAAREATAIPSLVADETGAIRAYHYSPNEFSRFDLGKAGSETDPGMMGRALYFSTDPAVAKAGPHRYEVNLDIKSPLNIEHPSDFNTSTKSDLAGAALGLEPPVRGALTVGKSSPTLPEWRQWSETMAEEAKKRGHDAAVLDYSPAGYPHQEIAVYDPSIIQFLRKYGIVPPLAAGAAGGGLLAEDRNQ